MKQTNGHHLLNRHTLHSSQIAAEADQKSCLLLLTLLTLSGGTGKFQSDT